ncbi:hypothetical protein HOLleu_35333 [Holothuria leucospilota]|uniref:Uncharacterized protein n=1 Tax=Holothuria leucospilota TaxID=206669 RepID=A0A9Q0YPA4_HOLLE|nr:hypothetical protein HOLleu_35333 [Holothuria leucospilota]
MRGCPVGWPLQISVQDERSGIITQACRNQNGDWKCTNGWQRLEEESRCIYPVQLQVNTSPVQPQVTQMSEVIINRSSVLQPKYAPVSDKRKLLFIHIPKAGGTTIETSFLFDDRRAELNGAYLGGHNKIIAFDKEFFKSYYKFSMIRHPCSRLISTWSYYSQGLGNAADRRWVQQHIDNRSLSSFDSFVTETLYPGGTLKVTNQVHLQPQVNMIFDKQGNFALNQLLIFENWNESFDALGKRTSVDMSPLKASHKLSSKHADCQSVYTFKAWQKMADVYAMDFCVLGYSSNINEIKTIPSVNLTPEYLTQRYADCADKLTKGAANSVLSHKKKDETGKGVSDSMTSPDYCTIHTYFEPQPNASPSTVENEKKLIEAWRAAWLAAGWTPRVLTETDAKSHPDYMSFRERFWKLPTVNVKEYEVACLMRHVAMAAVGGGWMSDYDVIPFHFPACTKPFNDGIYTVYMLYTPSLVSASATEFTRVSNLMADVQWRDQPHYFSFKGVFHVSDMFVIKKLVEEKAIRTMRVVMEARQLFTPFSCENSLGYKSVPKGMSSLPWAIHFSHSSLGTLGNSNVSSIWPGSLWNSKKLSADVDIVRPKFMTDAASFLRKTCLTGD